MVEKPTVDPNPVDDSPLKADFASDESKTTYYQMGWDSTDEAETWSYYGKVERPWTLTKAPAISGTNSFNTIDEDSKLSLTVRGNDEIELKERAISPYMTVMSNSEVEFYACFHGVWVVNGRWKLNIYDNDNGGVQETLVDGFMYAQETGFVGPNWIRFNVPLEKYAGHRCAFEFSYEGMGGESVSFDGFKLNQVSEASDAAINIVVGQSVHFKSTGTGTPDSYEWTFEGGDVATSTDAAPVVTYFTPGEYSVTLVVHRGEEKDEMTKEKVVVVKEAAPTAWIGAIEDSYYSPWVYSFVPTNVPVKFTNESTGYPTSFNWTFEGTDIATSTDATPTVTYTSVGVFDVKLEVANSVGKNKDELGDAIQAGGTQDVWNIANNELEVFDVATIYGGYYGGSNLYGMNAYAEHFHKPLAPASVDGATIYFAYTTSEDPDALMTVSLCFADENGLPGKPVASKSLKISELAYDEEKIVGTKFMFDEAVDVDSEFFITVSGFPVLDAKNKVVMFAVCRDYGSFTSTCHLLEDEDENYNPLGTYTWYKNEEAISFLLTAHLTYKETVSTSIDAPRNVAEGKSIFTLDGRKVENADKAGVYVVREGNNVRKITVK
ncbi:MAG: PKD domain-containing protein [Bacteroidaceae bacterium]|nr:PKD domain-containing protein [Bacteroidaceae bacterium]